MKKTCVGLALMVGCVFSMSAWAGFLGFFPSCDAGPKEPKPDWVSKLDYSLPEYYVGVGSAEKDSRGKDEQRKSSENNAKSHLVQQIEVTIKAENEQSTRTSNRGIEKDALSKVNVSAEEVLRGLKVKGRWVDVDSCTVYTLMVISRDSVAQAKREKVMKNRLEQFKRLMGQAVDRSKYRDIKVRRKFLEEAQVLLAETNFNLLPEEMGKELHTKQLNEEFELLNKETSQTQGRMAIYAVNQDGRLRADQIGKMLELMAGDTTADRLLADCTTVDDCIGRAKEMGFEKILILNVSSQVETSAMSSIKGTLTVSRTVYDIESRKIVQGPDSASAHVIGWTNEEFNENLDVSSQNVMLDLK